MRPLALLALLLPACGSPQSPPPASATQHESTAFAPTPYTAEQIHAATRVGRRYEWRVESEGQPTELRAVEFTAVGDERAEMSVSVTDEQGQSLGAPQVRTATWDELRRHAEFPRESVRTREEEVTVPAGRFACVVYTVTEGAGADATVSTFYFAREMPGAPVLFFTERGGHRVMTSTLVAYRAER